MKKTGEEIQKLIQSVEEATENVEGGKLKVRAIAATPMNMPENIMRLIVEKGLPMMNETGGDLVFVKPLLNIPLPNEVEMGIWIMRHEAALKDLELCERFSDILATTNCERLNIIF